MTEKRFHIKQEDDPILGWQNCKHEWVTHKVFATDDEIICRKCNLYARYWIGTFEVANAAPQGVITFEEQEK